MPRIEEHSATGKINAARKAAFDPAQKIRLQKAVKDFEAVLLGFMLKNMRGSIQKEGLFGESFGGDMMDSMFDSEMAKEISRESSLGIADTLYRQITGEKLPERPVPMTEWISMLRAAKSTKSTPSVGAPSAAAPSVIAPSAAVPSAVVPAVAVASVISPASVLPALPSAAASLVASADQTRVLIPPVPTEKPLPHKSTGSVSGKTKDRIESYAAIIDTAAQKHGVDPNLVRAVIATESAGKADARSSKQAKGLMQLIDSTAHDMGVRDVWDPEENINGGTKYLKQMMDRCKGDLKLTLASYNAGPGAVEHHNGMPPYRETRDYVNRVIRYLQIFSEESSNAK